MQNTMNDKELTLRIQFWESALQQHRLLMGPSTIVIVEQTVKDLKKLVELKDGLGRIFSEHSR